MFEKWRDPMFIDIAHHHYRLRLEIDAFVGAASAANFKNLAQNQRMNTRPIVATFGTDAAYTGAQIN